MAYAVSPILASFRYPVKSISDLKFVRCISTIKASPVKMAVAIF